MRPEYVPDDAEDITDYGAETNPDDPDMESAQQNYDAIQDAMEEAGEGGSIYVPEGTFIFGDSWSVKIDIPRRYDNTPPGISLYGAGPDKSTVGPTVHSSSNNYNLFRYYNDDGADWPSEGDDDWGPHTDEITIRGLEIDGRQWEVHDDDEDNVGNLIDIEGHQEEFVHIRDVHIHDSISTAMTLSYVEGEVEWVTSERHGIAAANKWTGRHLTPRRLGTGNEMYVHDCLFLNCTSSAINFSSGDGDLTVENCYIMGGGNGIIKNSEGDRHEMRHVYAQSESQYLIDNVPERDDANGPEDHYWGRWFSNRGQSPTTAQNPPDLILEHVEYRDGRAMGFQASGDHHFSIEGDMIAIHNTPKIDSSGGSHWNMVFWEKPGENDETLHQYDIKRMSVHGLHNNVDVFSMDSQGGTGEIETLHYDTTASRGSYSNDLSIGWVLDGDPFEPDVPTWSEVGANIQPISDPKV